MRKKLSERGAYSKQRKMRLEPMRSTSSEDALSDQILKCVIQGYLEPILPANMSQNLELRGADFKKMVKALRAGIWPDIHLNSVFVRGNWQTERKREERRFGGNVDEMWFTANEDTPFEALVRKEQNEILRRAFDELSDRDREVLSSVSDFLGKRDPKARAEAAERMHVTPEHLAVIVYRAIHKLTSIVKALDYDFQWMDGKVHPLLEEGTIPNKYKKSTSYEESYLSEGGAENQLH